ncbi:MAG: SoxR reducing system RseC family protein [Fermentimonas sp.]|jgi:sigma-E factor negative regulatory protein RseC|nr:SoxR reducing system RseC family protein [Fermentimonas sp.]HBT86788.1 Fis family transcriptional regulator [Porphyromonadaceae bacterium]MDD2931740.1 SoxR reducing system RseC family protein [Fermentimonas sp.]MDD3189471.1 SoxR reducing system RseC family protein [Fermentimonas sp.]MDD4284027.1 SoxR reducing system RseC family protein [Fermentimonas sp.]
MIEHEGIIEKINGNQITVRIIQKSACSSCHAKGACIAADSKEKLVNISDNTGQFFEKEKVIIEGKESMGYTAILWAFVVPLIILISILVLSLNYLQQSETEAALISIIALVPYYFILYLFRNKMANSFKFSIKKTN